MNHDDFSFFNQQLAAMLRDGIPLEGALKRLCSEMRRGPLRDELTKLGDDLAKGMPLRQALQARQLPELYRLMLEVGAQANDLPAVLTLLADHYQRRQLLSTRLKGLMVYPVIVLIASLVLSLFLAIALTAMMHSATAATYLGNLPASGVGVWYPPVFLAVLVVLCCIAAGSARIRRALRWRAPAFRDASISQVASAMALMLKNGVPLDKALALLEQVERGTPAESDIALWRQHLALGHAKFSDLAAGGRVFPPLFVWMVAQSGEDLPAGFQRAAEIYQARAAYRAETLLYSALPCSVLALALVIVSQIQPVLATFVLFMNAIGENT